MNLPPSAIERVGQVPDERRVPRGRSTSCSRSSRGFDGVVALCTNFFETLDAAVLRRLDVKVRFARLKALHAAQAFFEAARTLGVDRDEAACVLVEQPLRAERYALGDLAVSVRQARLRSKAPTARLLRDCLEAEARTRGEREGRAVGFHA